VTARVEPERDLGLQGHYAGIVTRLVAFAIDVFLAMTLFTLGGNVFEYVFSAVLNRDISLSDRPVIAAIALALWLLLYFAYPVAASGRTLGMALVGLEVVSKDGGDVGPGQALLRTIAIPISLVLLAIGILMILLNRQRRALHDLIAGTAVVYSWNARAARLRFLARTST
jgi:uncharacterized RDD family membrane protein YckC